MTHHARIAAASAALLAAAAATPAAQAQPASAIPGYTMDQASLARAPFTLADLASLKKALLFTDEDIRYLRMSQPILADQHARVRHQTAVSSVFRQPVLMESTT